ncbi:MAG: family 16 glycosylhydrolase [Granulosicoccus sp.]
MTIRSKALLATLLASTLVACSDSSTNSNAQPAQDDQVDTTVQVPVEGAGDPTPIPDGGDGVDIGSENPDTPTTGAPDTDPEMTPVVPAVPDTNSPVVQPGFPDPGTPQVPTLDDPLADAIESPDADDPFGFGLDFDGEPAVEGGPPTQPKNLRLELVSNNWAELNWAPSNDDGQVVQYTLKRDDGVEYVIRSDQTGSSGGSQAEIDKYWSSTSFIDCNFTRFDQLVHACGDGRQPIPGTTYIYTVTATDDENQESAASEPLSITYLKERNAPVPNYDDFFRDPNDTFVQDNDLSSPQFFLNNGFQLVFQDEFNGTSLDLEKWQTRLTWGDETIINGEQQYFVNTQDDPDFGYDPFKFTGESLIIEAIPVPDELRANLPDSCDDGSRPDVDECEFLSGALSSFDRYSHLYGYTEGRFKVSGAPGALSTFYLYHRYKGTDNNFHAPEIDIMEYLGENPFGDEDAFQTYHYETPSPDGVVKRSAPTMSAANPAGVRYGDDGQWHTFSVLWEPQLVIWYIDGIEVKRMFGPQVSRRPMNIITYLVTGSEWAPTPDAQDESLFPMQLEVDYIRVYQRGQYIR